MEENEFRDALHTVLTLSPEPPPMASATTIAAGKRAERRRTVLACAGVVVVLAAVAVVPARYPGTDPAPIEAVAPAPSADGQPDGDADTGHHYLIAQKLVNVLLTKVPTGYQASLGRFGDGNSLARTDVVNGVWSYVTTVKITKGGSAGELAAELHEPDKRPTDPCALTASFWGGAATCQVRKVGSAVVGVATATDALHQYEQWVAYRYPDGGVVVVGQDRDSSFEAIPSLAELPFTATELARLATDPEFRVTS
ncbi:hypothetical protein GCM10010168_74290 [Actinoplanes ianthinogenes]|uniref:Uncharacterized protein n=1 Tax=Actinoplanes ianthinogenes TaxID=122358 RepID=A0ABN6C7Y8_9ACTN|nr:hypothetical protein [Actinoplanes ianthinogenes]BCJ40583.1 hypothetical protein Aiant_12400 [Actinoplanes ianthinogenes]GGR44339.1 hypothetical protein GCM10010168_74290 [Actinoplanes ianthinogenes]